jgi:hypothetical protein
MIEVMLISFFMVGSGIVLSILIFKLTVLISHVILAVYVITLFVYLKGLVEDKINEFKKKRHLQENTEKEQQKAIEEERSGYVR